MTPTKFAHHIRVYYEYTDAGGVVYHSNYLNFMERARTEFLRAQGFTLDVLEQEHNLIFAVREAHVIYEGPARLDDLLRIETIPVEARGARLVFQQEVFCQERCCARGEITVVTLDAKRFRPKPLPEFLRAAFCQKDHHHEKAAP